MFCQQILAPITDRSKCPCYPLGSSMMAFPVTWHRDWAQASLLLFVARPSMLSSLE